ncbi:MAG: single-stranded DNA-binding protein [Bacteroidales bacterium]|nr:single-stranded DNA-binding protein [Bacteroidales bacterium]MDP2235752.1 single-stranded DNA-binding protein [Bacteroidales bacterium]
MAGLNKVMLIGRLGKDPEVISFENGGKKMTVSLATSERYRDREGNWQDQTEWHNIVAWGNLASDIAEKRRNYIKGDLLFIEGKIKSRQYTDSQGVNKSITEIIAEKMNLISKGGNLPVSGAETKYERGQTEENKSAPYEAYPSASSAEEDLPF